MILKRTPLHIFLLLFAFIMIYPVLWMISSSFKSNSEIFSNFSLWPIQATLSNYSNGWFGIQGFTFGTFILNSIIVAGLVVVGTLFSVPLTAYGFARLKFKFKNILFAIMMITIMLPSQVTLIPQYILFHQLNWINTYLPLVVPSFFGGTPFFIFLTIQFIRGIPKELDEAATIDGCNKFQTFYRIILPLCSPALITSAIFSFFWTWVDFFGQIIYLNDTAKFTVPVALRLFMDQTSSSQWGSMFAMSVASLIPVMLVFVIFQKYIVQGIATTGLKG
jgi:multiple sugar transport system permease protein